MATEGRQPDRPKGRCMICFECGENAEYQHHVIPKSKGGRRTVPLCGVCHVKIHGRLALHTADLTRDALRVRKENGMKTGGTVPFGYHVKKGRLIKDGNEQKAVRLILALSRKGESLRGICRELEAAGVARKQGSRTWHPQVVSDILQRELKAALI